MKEDIPKASISEGKAPVEEVDIPEFSYSLQTSIFRKEHRFASRTFGNKKIQSESLHKDVIGENPTSCRNLYGLGYTLQGQGFNLGLTEYSNHVWIPQTNLSDPQRKPLQVCFNCGSVMINDDKDFTKNRFYSYLDIEKYEKKKEKQKEKTKE